MPELKVYEEERGYIDYTLTYSQTWSVVVKRGTPLLRADVSRVYFYVKNALTDASPVISLSDANSTQIEWLDEDEGEIRVKLGTNTADLAGDNKAYELRVKLSDGSFITADYGTMHILNSVVDSP